MSLGNFQFWKDVASQLRTSVPFVSEALNVLPLIDTKRVPYAATDGRSIMVNTEGWAEMEEHLKPLENPTPLPRVLWLPCFCTSATMLSSSTASVVKEFPAASSGRRQWTSPPTTCWWTR